MPKWGKDEKEFKVRLSYHKTRGYQTYIPRPVIEHLNLHPKKDENPSPITFAIKGKKVELKSSSDEQE
jgi:hypothetical protein